MRAAKSDEKKPLLKLSPQHDKLAPSATSGFADRYPSQHSNCLTSLFFLWLNPLMKLGSEKPLEHDDLFQLDPYNRANCVKARFEQFWEQEIKLSKAKNMKCKNGKKAHNPNLGWALAHAFGGPFLVAGLLKLLHDTLQFVSPLVINRIIAYLNVPSAPLSEGIMYAAIIFVSGVVQSFALRQYFFYCYECGMRLRSAIVCAVYSKSLRLSSAARQKRTSGEIINLMSVDAQRLQELTPFLHSVWYALYQICISCILLWRQIGVATFAGVGVILILIPMTTAISKRMRSLQVRLMRIKDERIKICHEILSGIKIIKMKTWEGRFTHRVMEYRTRELRSLKSYIYAQSISSALFNFVPTLVTTVSFYTYVKLGNVLDVATALTSLALFDILRFPLFMLPNVINNLVEATVSTKRLRDFLMEEEYEAVGSGDLKSVGVRIVGADLSWNRDFNANCTSVDSRDGTIVARKTEATAVLRDINLEARPGDLIAIVGHVGEGKSTLLSGILGDARASRGSVSLRGSVCYVAQQPFIQNASIRDNILFGQPFDANKYDEALRVSCLTKDLKIFPGGDQTEIGEKGINLSGGQRTRVAIARAVYHDADIYILDDVLSAVDSHVASEIFEECIKKKLADKLVLLATHSLSFLSQCSRIIVLADGSIAEEGQYKQLLAKPSGCLARMMESYIETDNFEEDASQSKDKDCCNNTSDEQHVDGLEDGIMTVSTDIHPSIQREASFRSDTSSSLDNEILVGGVKLMTDEERSTGDVPWPIYRAWILAFGGFTPAILTFIGYCIAQAISLLSTVWISYWSEHADSSNSSQMFFLNIYMGINGVLAITYFFRTFALLAGGLRASKILFNAIFSRILLAPVSFFDTTPLGRIVNRLSKDIYTIDEGIPSTCGTVLNITLNVLSTIGIVLYVTPLFAIFLVPVLIGYYKSQRYFMKTSRELQRLDSISRSPVYAMLSETLDGLATIRAYRAENRFVIRNQFLLDKNQRAFFLNFSVNCWLALRLEFVGTLIGTGAALGAVITHVTAQSSSVPFVATTGVGSGANSATFAGLVGVSLTYAFSVTQIVNWMARMVSQLQTQMVSVERVKTYAEIDSEAALESSPDRKPPTSWPHAGKIAFENVRMRYRPGLPRVLRGLTFTVNPREKIGIVGRTGAGKSSLIVALMRLTELDGGRILIDDRDISTLGLHDLRGRLAIIPQDPVLFSGSVRFNLDPFDQYTDDQLWTSVKRVHLQRAVSTLDAAVEEKGCNFSVGERQLLCIARALLQGCKIILMDEATASIDSETDRKIQLSIREEFKDCTCLTVAHRLNTIMDADRILVLDKGKVAEYGPPNELLGLRKGLFKSLLDQSRQSKE
uniref:MultidrugResistance like protein 1 putative n=1 Tax=Albugo laibachii Nc14 TaxID=890382 RepID=F0WAU4_9STRA|nr:MultidrugResistance like protein 1 putative [Albugo laibachii Nc14]|eukprot:CCA18266.1 MultidrugResistance like protein 1 putative [Albugo laibachii Nc14]